MSDISKALKAFFNTGKGTKTLERFITEKSSLIETYVGQFSRASDARNSLIKKFKTEYQKRNPNSRKFPSIKFDFEALWSSAQIQKALVLERNDISVKLVRTSGKQIQNKLDAVTDKDDSERGLPKIDSDSFDDHPEDENNHSEQRNLLYTIKDNGKIF